MECFFRFKKLCLASVSTVVFLGAASTITPSYGMNPDDGKEENKSKKKELLKKQDKVHFRRKQDNTENKENFIIEIKEKNPQEIEHIKNKYPDCQRSNKNDFGMFDNTTYKKLPVGLIKKIFSYLNIKKLKNLRLVCKYFKYLEDQNPKLLTSLFYSDKTWRSPEMLLDLFSSCPPVFNIVLDKLDPLGLFQEPYSMRRVGEMIKLRDEDRPILLSIYFKEMQENLLKYQQDPNNGLDFDKIQKTFVVISKLIESNVKKSKEDSNENLLKMSEILSGNAFELHTRLDEMQEMVIKVVGDNVSELCLMKMRNLLELKEKLQTKIIETGEKLGFRKTKKTEYGYTEVKYDYTLFSKVAQKNENQSLLQEHMKCLWIHDLLEDHYIPEKSALVTFDNLFYSKVFPDLTSKHFKIEKNWFNKTLVVDKKFNWLQKASFWAGFSNFPATWYLNFAFYPKLDDIKDRLPEAKKIFTLFSDIFKDKDEGYLTSMESFFKECTGEEETPYDWKEELKKTTRQFEETDSPSFDQILRQANDYATLGEDEKSIKLWDLILKNLEEKPNEIKFIIQDTEKELEDFIPLRLYVLIQYLETIFTSDFLPQYRQKGFDLLKEIQKVGKNYKDFSFNIIPKPSDLKDTLLLNIQDIFSIYFDGKYVSFFENCFNYFNDSVKLKNCFKKEHIEDWPEILLNVIFHKNVNNVNNLEKKESTEIKKYVFNCLENRLADDDLNEQKRNFIKKLFSDDKKKLKKIEKLFMDKNDKYKEGSK